MGSCAGKDGSPYEEFNVTNINDQHRLVHSGVMYVTDSDLVYIDKKSHEKWEWPLKFLRRYGCEGYVFSFEAGRKCPSGEGLYAFNCKRANALFNQVAQNISQGHLEPTEPELPERNADVPFPPKINHVSNGSSSTLTRPVPDIPTTLPPIPPPANENGRSNTNYTDLQFNKGLNEKPPPVQDDMVNYTKIDVERTIQVTKLREQFHGNSGGLSRRLTTGNLPGKKMKDRSSSCSSSSSVNTDQALRIRSLDDDHRNSRKPSAPDVLLRPSNQQRTSPPLLPETVTEAPSENDTDPYKSSREPNYLNIHVGNGENQHNYSNMSVGVIHEEQSYANIKLGGEEEPNYTNISVGSVSELRRPSINGIETSEHNYSNITVGEHNYTNISVGVAIEDSLDTSVLRQHQDQPNYQNLIPGQGLVSSTPVTTPTQNIPGSLLSPDATSPGYSPHPRSSTFNHSQIKPMSSTGSSSTLPMIKGGGNTMQTYIELDINTPKASATMGSYAELEISSNQPSSVSTPIPDDGRHRSQSALIHSPHPIQEDGPDTLYKELNFQEMETLRVMVQDRDNLKNAPQQQPTHSDSDKKHKTKK